MSRFVVFHIGLDAIRAAVGYEDVRWQAATNVDMTDDEIIHRIREQDLVGPVRPITVVGGLCVELATRSCLHGDLLTSASRGLDLRRDRCFARTGYPPSMSASWVRELMPSLGKAR